MLSAKSLEGFITEGWYQKAWWCYFLLPFSWFYRCVSNLRRIWLQSNNSSTPVPTIVVGNISVGGTGKTPLLIALVRYLQSQGVQPGVVSRGYGGRSKHYPLLLKKTTLPFECGDEPALIYSATGCPVAVAPDRNAAIRCLVEQTKCNIILSDDGLQHYAMARDFEIAVVDGQRGFGNGFCLPAGPLRESVSRLKSVDFIMSNGGASGASLDQFPAVAQGEMQIAPAQWRNIKTRQTLALEQNPFASFSTLVACAGIGNPQRFFETLKGLGLTFTARSFPDHYHYSQVDFVGLEHKPVVMTSKDAIKCVDFAGDNWWALEINAELPDTLIDSLKPLINSIIS